MNRYSSAAAAAILALSVPAVQAQNAAGNDSMSAADQMQTGTAGSNETGSVTGGTSAGAASGTTSASEPGASGASNTANDEASALAELPAVVVSVGGTDITADQVREMLASMPPQLQSQPAELVVPFAVEELVMRELVLQAARAEGLHETPQVQEMADAGASEQEIEDAVMASYLSEPMENAATDEAVQAAYDEAAAASTGEVPSLDEVRPQIERQLQQRRLLEIRDELKGQVDVVYYGPDGEPREDGPDGAMSEGGSGAASSGEGASGNSGSASGSAGAGTGTTAGSAADSTSSASSNESGSADGSPGSTGGGTATGSGSAEENGGNTSGN